MSNPKNLSAQKLYLVISGSTTCAHVPSCAQAQYLHFRHCVCNCIMIVVRIHLRMGGWVSSTTVLWVSSAIYSCTRQVWDILGVVGIFSSLAPQKQFSYNMAGYLRLTHVRYSCDTWTLNCSVGKRLRDENPTLAVKTCALELRCFRCVYTCKYDILLGSITKVKDVLCQNHAHSNVFPTIRYWRFNSKSGLPMYELCDNGICKCHCHAYHTHHSNYCMPHSMLCHNRHAQTELLHRWWTTRTHPQTVHAQMVGLTQ